MNSRCFVVLNNVPDYNDNAHLHSAALPFTPMTKEIKFVKKRNGRLAEYQPDKINKTALRVCDGLADVSASELVLDAMFQLQDKTTTSAIDLALIQSARNKIHKEPNYSYVAARLVTSTIYREVFGDNVNEPTFDHDYRASFRAGIRKGIALGILSEKMEKLFDLKALSEYIVPSRDDKFKFTGISILMHRYLLRDKKTLFETPQAFWMRIAMGLSLNEENPTYWAKKFYDVFSEFRYTPSTPTLFNSGTKRSQLSSCFLNTFEDSIDGIFEGVWQEARKSKFAGGLGFDVTNWRALGSAIDGVPNVCNGIVPWLKVINDMLIAVNQKGKRPGAGCAYLEVWHRDIERFLELRRNTGDDRARTHDLNIAAWTNDLFMRRVKANGKWYLFCPSEAKDLHGLYGKPFETRYNYYCALADQGKMTNYKIVDAKDLWKKMIQMLFETSYPWITFKDPCNIRYSNQHVGVVNSSNLCTEITLHTEPSRFDAETNKKTQAGETAVCNLGSINLPSHIVIDAQQVATIDKAKLAETIAIARRALDNVIDLNYYPTQEARNSSKKHRPVGLGVMGLQDVMHALDIQIDGPAALDFNDELFEFFSAHCILAGAELARERGSYQTYKGSLWDQGLFPRDTYLSMMRSERLDIALNVELTREPRMPELWAKVREAVAKFGVRNSVCMAIAPTATIGDINGVEQSIEPSPSVCFVKENYSGNFISINEQFVKDMKKAGLWNAAMIEQVVTHDGDLSQLNIPQYLKSKYASVAHRDMYMLIKANAVRQKWIDQSISFNLYYFGESSKELSDMYFACWETGHKTTYYLRNTAASQIEKATTGSQTRIEDPAVACSIESKRLRIPCESCQ